MSRRLCLHPYPPIKYLGSTIVKLSITVNFNNRGVSGRVAAKRKTSENVTICRCVFPNSTRRAYDWIRNPSTAELEVTWEKALAERVLRKAP